MNQEKSKEKADREDERKPKPEIFQYLNYRLYLQDFCDHLASLDKAFSLRSFSTRISPSLAGSGLLSAILKGKRNLSATLRPRVAKVLGLKEREQRYFEFLVQFNQAKGMEEKNRHFVELSQFRNSRAKIVNEGQYKFYSKWYYPVVWNYFSLENRLSAPAEIGKRIYPALTAAQVEEAIRLLLSLKLLKKMANGYAVAEPHLATEKEFRGLIAKQYNQHFINMAYNMLEAARPEHRQYNTLIFSISEAGFGAVKERIISFQEELKDIIDRDKDSDRIYTLSMQLYPNTKITG